jgi:hypothetical protein
MEERGINAEEHMKFIDQRANKMKSELITGSMRTVRGLASAIMYNTIPTIGTKVIDLLKLNSTSDFISLWEHETADPDILFSPTVTSQMTALSDEFFKQMDTMGKQLNLNLS